MKITSRNLRKAAKYLASKGFYREAADMQEIAEENEEGVRINMQNDIETTLVFQVPLDEEGEQVGDGQVFIQAVIQDTEGEGQIVWQMAVEESGVEEEED